MCLLRHGDVYIVAGPYPEWEPAHYDYFFHSHTCPENILRNVQGVFEASQGEDPHGILRFVAAVPVHEPFDPMKCFGDGWTLEQLFQHFGTDGTEAQTRWPESDHGVLPWLAELQRRHKKLKAAKA